MMSPASMRETSEGLVKLDVGMICSICGGDVTWRGPLIALTHTQCGSCGEKNCQEVSDEADSECLHCDGEGRIEADNNGPIEDCPACNGSGLLPSAD